MPYRTDLDFLCDTFNKCRIHINFLNPKLPLGRNFSSLNTFLDENHREDRSFFDIFGHIEKCTVYKIREHGTVNHIFMLLPTTETNSLMLIGPFLSEPITPEHILEIVEAYSIPPKARGALNEFYAALPILPHSSHLFFMLDSFCERMWGDGYSLIDLNDIKGESFTPFSEPHPADSQQPLINMRLMEERYRYENEIMEAVASGQAHKADLIFSRFSSMDFEKRLADPIRNIKNYGIIMNTLLRKAAENGGAHPLYLNDISSAFAAKIELITSINGANELMLDMFRSYANLVKRNSMKQYCAPVQKAIVYIDANLSSGITLRTLAKEQNISSGYLSAVFKRETGKNVTEYINEKRIELAKKLLGNTKLQIQTVASHCGILDIHYFSKLFKKYTGKTPKEYRKFILGTLSGAQH